VSPYAQLLTPRSPLHDEMREVRRQLVRQADALERLSARVHELVGVTSRRPSCPVCRLWLGAAQHVRALSCGHVFCEPCLSAALRRSEACPSCGVPHTAVLCLHFL
jgi:hypothetical protein